MCITYKACRYACYKLVKTIIGLINKLWTLINTYKATCPQESKVFNTCPQDNPNNPKVYFTDH